jgi:hypothetical protein
MCTLRRTVFLAALWIGAASPARTAAPPASGVPADLALVHASTYAIVSVRPAALLAGEPGRDLRRCRRLSTFPISELLDQASLFAGGVPLAELERVSVVVTDAGMAWLLTSARPLDRDKVILTLGINAPPLKRQGCTFHVAGPEHSVAFVGQRTFLLGPVKALEGVVMPRAGRTPMNASLAKALRAADRHHLVAAVRAPRPGELGNGAGDAFGGTPAGKEMARALGALSSACLLVTFDRTFALRAEATFDTEEGAARTKKLLEMGRNLALEHLDELGEILAERLVPAAGPSMAKDVLAFFRAAGPVLRGLRVERKGKELAAEVRLPGRGALWALSVLGMPTTRTVRIDNPSEAQMRMIQKEEELRKAIPPAPAVP